jgi:hypothetical protein
MKISIGDKDSFIKKFLIPISKLSEGAAIKRDKTNPKVITALVNNPERTVILYATFTCATEMEPFRIDIGDIAKMAQCIGCINDNEIVLERPNQPAPKDDQFENYIKYTSSDIKFKFHLLEDDVVTVPKVNVDKIKSQTFDVSFPLSADGVNNIMKAGAFASDSNKIYFSSTEDGKVHVELTDKQKDNMNSFGRIVSTELSGTIPEPIPVGFDMFRLVSGNRFTETTRALINTQHRVFLFDISDETSKLNYIATGFTG